MFDYIIIGAGSAGCVLANRLTEDLSLNVLLLEAGGPDKDRRFSVPAGFPKLFKSPYDWAYHTTEQSALMNRVLFVPRGKVMGGSSSINAMIYMRGNPLDYDEWEQLGNRGWGWNSVLPYFKKSEDQLRGASNLHGTGGPLSVSDPVSPNILSKAFLNAVQELHLPLNEDFNGPKQDGFGFYQRNVSKGKRVSAATAFLKPAIGRSNLKVISQAKVTRLVVESGKVKGVEYLLDKQKYFEPCGREVILCAGSINTPQLMMLSGLGPASHLQQMGIEVVKDIQGVGRNLQDHPFAMIVARTSRNITLDDVESNWNYLKYFLLRKGPLTSNVAEAGGFIRSDENMAVPDVQLFFVPAFFINHGFDPPGGNGFSIGPCLVKPISRGELTLKSSNPEEAPNIDPRLLSMPDDMDAMVEGYKVAAKILHTRTFVPYIRNYFAPLTRLNSVGEIMQFIRENCEAMYHPVGTCKMGNDAMAVVDDRLKVRGLEGLRVADASVMPTIIRGNTNAPTIMIAEKAADIIKAEK